MKTEKARTVLKITGILAILGSVAAFAIMMKAKASAKPGLLGAGNQSINGIETVVSSVANLGQGVFSLLASRDNKYGTAAWTFSVFSLFGVAYSSFTAISQSGINASIIINMVIAMSLAVIVNVAAYRLRKANKTKKKQTEERGDQ